MLTEGPDVLIEDFRDTRVLAKGAGDTRVWIEDSEAGEAKGPRKGQRALQSELKG